MNRQVNLLNRMHFQFIDWQFPFVYKDTVYNKIIVKDTTPILSVLPIIIIKKSVKYRILLLELL